MGQKFVPDDVVFELATLITGPTTIDLTLETRKVDRLTLIQLKDSFRARSSIKSF